MRSVVRARAFLSAGLCAVAMAGCSTISYNYDFDPAMDFSKYKSYAWIEVVEPSRTLQRGVSQLVEKRIITSVDKTLASKGYTKKEEGPADFVVHFMGTTQEKVDFDTYYTGWGYHGWYGATATQAYSYTEGTLIIDFFDGASKQQVWRGMAQGTIDPNISPEGRNARIDEAVQGIFQRFPPGPPR